MQIIGNKEETDIITFVHKGKNLKFNCYAKTGPYENDGAIKEPKRAEIVFSDLMEVDNMIEILTRFRKECRDYIGVCMINE